ncbi:MAG: Fur family transcriptional regulator [Mycobacteriales bacterium]
MGHTVSSDDAAERLRARGQRVTQQRRLVLEAVATLGHATPEQIHAAIQPGADLSTIYRTLELLEGLELVQHTHLGHGSPTWSLAQEDVHVHLVCRQCDAVREIPAEVVAGLQRTLDQDEGFAIDLSHLALTGLCEQCRTNRDKTR